MNIKVIKDCMSYGVIRDIIEIDKQFYKDFDYSDTSWYYERYSDNNEVFLMKDGDKVVGYFLFYSITKNLFEKVCNLEFHGDWDFPLEEIVKDSGYYYMPSIVVLKDYRKYAYPLIIRLKQELDTKDKVVVIAVSKEGKRMAKKCLNFLGKTKKNNDVEIYAKH